MRVLTTLLVVVAALAGYADACGRRGRSRNGNQAITITARNPPITNPPSPAPTPPPPPPPIPVGWVPPPPRPPAQEMTRTNCKAHVEFQIQDSGMSTQNGVDRQFIQESWVYTCKFHVYVEVAVAETDKPQNCACGLSVARKNVEDPNVQKAHTTKVLHFSMVAFDVVRGVVVGVFAKNTFDQMTQNQNTTNDLTKAVTSGMDYSQVTQGFSGMVKAISKEDFPAALQEGNELNNPNIVPAMCFSIEEEYSSTYKWPEPAIPLLYTTPNVWVSQCYPYIPTSATTAKRAVDTSKQVYWFRDYLLFPVGESQSRSGFQARERYITSWYRNSNCDSDAGVASWDREFTSTITRLRGKELYGAFHWKRKYLSVHVIGGVPIGFSSNLQFWRTGYTKVSWKETYGRDDSQHYRPGVLYHALLGTPENNGAPFIGATADTKLCEALPPHWADCAEESADCANSRSMEYGEFALNFKVPEEAIRTTQAEAKSTLYECEEAVPLCKEDVTYLSFQNFGRLARDYSKRRDSILLTGPRRMFCVSEPTSAVFDSLYFKPYSAATKLMRKRQEASGVDPMLDALDKSGMKFNADGEVNIQPGAPVPGGEDGVSENVIRAGTGSADENGRPGGDHPVSLFPETYTVPVTLNPEDTTYDEGVRGTLFDGVEAPCLEGQRGCTCRDVAANSLQRACDAPLQCNDGGFCEPEFCAAGQPGCPCLADGKCGADVLTCNASEDVCEFRPKCTAGAAGCTCAQDADCKDEGSFCGDGYCVAAESACTAGAAGCECAEGACTDKNMECNAEGTCAVPQCNVGERGCACNLGQCEAGFECSSTNVCKQTVCVPGTAGCPCITGVAADKQCAENFECTAFRVDGSDNRCAAKGKNCGDQTDACIKYCGEGNVAKCPPCSNQTPVCAGVAQLVPSVLVALALAVLAALF